MIGFFKAAFKRPSGSGTGSGLGSPGAKPSMKVTPKGKTSRYRTFHKDEKGNEHGNRILVQDEDDNWYSEERNSKTGEVGYREYKVAGAGTDTKYNSITGRKEPVAEYDSKKQRIASDLARYNQTLRQEGNSLENERNSPVYSGMKGAKEFGNSLYLPPVDPRNKRTIAADTEREARDAPFKAPGFAGGPRIAPKKTGYDSFDHADRKAKEAKLTSEINSYMGDYHKVKPKSATGYDSFDAGFAKPHVTPKPAGTESAGSTRKPYDNKATDDFFSRLRPERAFRVDPAGVATEAPPQNQAESTETDGQRRKREAAARGRATAAANRAAKAAAAAAPPPTETPASLPVTPKKRGGRPKKSSS